MLTTPLTGIFVRACLFSAACHSHAFPLMSAAPLDVAVVGGGIAGLASARKLTQNGVRCKLFEGSNRLGGRMQTLYTESGKIELGAQVQLPATGAAVQASHSESDAGV